MNTAVKRINICSSTKKVFYTLLFIIISNSIFAQNMQIFGKILDSNATYLNNASIISIRLKDSVLIGYTRSDANGDFNLTIPLDTYRIIISHTRFSDKEYLLVGSPKNTIFNLLSSKLPTKTYSLKEITVFAFKDPIYFKGDTIVYTADSFKVKTNAVVEDLLKKLPGVEVDKNGGIKAQGKKVDKVLVDGDEFFGDDATIATKNLAANGVETIQIYDKKIEGTDEEQKILDLKLKESAKKGYFGKISAGADFKNYYEATALFNKFRKKEKLSFYLSGINTPNQQLDFGDSYKYGIDNDVNFEYDEESGSAYGYSNRGSGIPSSYNGAVSYSNKINKNKTKINAYSAYKRSELAAQTNTFVQSFLNDSVFYKDNRGQSNRFSDKYLIRTEINHTIDSSLTLDFEPSISYSRSQNNNFDSTFFLDALQQQNRKTIINNKQNNENLDLSIDTKLKKTFKNIQRSLSLNYTFTFTDNKGKGNLNTAETSFINNQLISNIDQAKNNLKNNVGHNINISYNEPLTKKTKLEFGLNNSIANNKTNNETFNFFNGEYTLKDSALSNNFIGKRRSSSLRTEFIYQVKKYSFRAGATVRQIALNNNNISSVQTFKQNTNVVLPKASFSYNINEGFNLRLRYRTNSEAPSASQLQPLRDNTNPNNITIGNDKLIPYYEHQFELSGNQYSMIKDFYFFANASYRNRQNTITQSQTIDNLGRTITQFINVASTNNSSVNFSTSYPIIKNKLKTNQSIGAFNSNDISVVNSLNYKNSNTGIYGGIGFSIKPNDLLDIDVNSNINYNKPSSTLSNSLTQPYTNKEFSGNINLKWPKKMSIASNVEYNIYGQRAEGFNPKVLLWGASIDRKFLKTENLIIGIKATDILNRNTQVNRTFSGNNITDNRTKVISRFVLLNVILKFNNNKTSYDSAESDFD